MNFLEVILQTSFFIEDVVESDIKVDGPTPVGQSAARLGPGDSTVLRASGDDIVLESLGDLAPEVDLGDEGDAPPPPGGDLEKTKAEYKRDIF